MSQSLILTRKGRLKNEHEEERVESMVKEGRFPEGEGGQTKRISLEEVVEGRSG